MDALRSGGSRRGILRTAALVPAAAVLAAGCTGTGSGLYSWGRYEDSVYDFYVRADSFDTADEIRRLGEDVDRAVSRGRRVPPGVR